MLQLFTKINPPIYLLFLCSLAFCVQSNAQQDNSNAPSTKQDPFTFKAVVQGGVFHNFSGGIKTGSDYMSRTHLTLSLDTKKAGLWKNGQFLVNGVNAHGGTPTATYIGDFQPISRNEASPRTGMFELWYKHTLGNASILIGQHDMNSSFGTSAYGGNSIHSAFGMNPSITPNAGYSFSIFPRTMPTVYVKYDSLKLGNNLMTIQAAVYAGASQNYADDPYNIRWNIDGTTHSRFEIHYKQMKNGVQRGIVKAGLLYHSGDFPDMTNPASVVNGNLGMYLITDQLILPEDEKSDQGLGVFFQVGSASGNQNLVDLFISTGILYKGLIPKRDQDALFIGLLNSSINDQVVNNFSTTQSRSVLELNYAMKLGTHFTIQPDLQYIINPGANTLLDNAFVGVLRFSIDY